MSTEGERAPPPPGASSGGKEVWRRGWAEPTDITEPLRRLRLGEGPPSAARFLESEEVVREGR